MHRQADPVSSPWGHRAEPSPAPRPLWAPTPTYVFSSLNKPTSWGTLTELESCLVFIVAENLPCKGSSNIFLSHLLQSSIFLLDRSFQINGSYKSRLPWGLGPVCRGIKWPFSRPRGGSLGPGAGSVLAPCPSHLHLLPSNPGAQRGLKLSWGRLADRADDIRWHLPDTQCVLSAASLPGPSPDSVISPSPARGSLILGKENLDWVFQFQFFPSLTLPLPFQRCFLSPYGAKAQGVGAPRVKLHWCTVSPGGTASSPIAHALIKTNNSLLSIPPQVLQRDCATK